jgi:putative ABC transport system permease protein
MLLAALRDLQWRRRRVAITVVGTGLVLAMTLILSGLSASFGAETAQFVDHLGADAFVYSNEAPGPFVGALPMPADQAATIGQLPGVKQASPMAFAQSSIRGHSSSQVNLVGVEIDGVGSPTPAVGKALSAPAQAVVSTKLGAHVGDKVNIGGRPVTVVGTTDTTLFAGVPVVFVPLTDLQKIAFGGAPLATVFATSGTPQELPSQYAQDDPTQAAANLAKPLTSAQGAISFLSILLWIVAGCVLASVMYLSAMERSRDFAVFKATGVSNKAIFGGLALQATMISLVAAVLGLVLGLLLGPRFPLTITLTGSTLLALPVVAVLVGLLASLVGMRRVASIDPAAAFAGP